MNKPIPYIPYLSLILLGGVFITSQRFMNVENDAKDYFIGIALILLLSGCSLQRKGLHKLNDVLRSSGICTGCTAVCMMLSAYGLLQYFGTVPSRHFAFPITGTYENPESSKPSGYYLVYAACLAAMNSDIERKCFNQYWYALGDLALTDIEWNGGIKQHAISEIGTNFESDSTIERGTIYYVKAVSYRNNPTYNFCFGDACVNFSINGEPCGFTDTYDFNARPWGERDGLAELVTRLVNIYGPYYGAEDYKIYYGII